MNDFHVKLPGTKYKFNVTVWHVLSDTMVPLLKYIPELIYRRKKELYRAVGRDVVGRKATAPLNSGFLAESAMEAWAQDEMKLLKIQQPHFQKLRDMSRYYHIHTLEMQG